MQYSYFFSIWSLFLPSIIIRNVPLRVHFMSVFLLCICINIYIVFYVKYCKALNLVNLHKNTQQTQKNYEIQSSTIAINYRD